MVGLFYEKVGETKGRVTTRHNFPENLSAEDKQKNYTEVDFVPEPENIAGKNPTLCVDLSNNSLFYEYEDVPVPDEVVQLQQRIADLEIAIAAIMGGAV